MLKRSVRVGLMLLLGVCGICEAADHWVVANRGPWKFIVRVRPASNRRAGFTATEVKPGDVARIPLADQGSYDLNIQYLNQDGGLMNSWTSDQPIDLRNRKYPETGENLMSVAMQLPPTRGPDGGIIMGAPKVVPMLQGVQMMEPLNKLVQIGAIAPEGKTVDFGGGVMVGDKAIHFRVSGAPGSPSVVIDGETYEVGDLMVSGKPADAVVAVSGTYEGGGKAGDFLLERREGFPFQRIRLDLKAKGEADWRTLQLGAGAAAGEARAGAGASLDEVRDVVADLQRPLGEAQARLETRLGEVEKSLGGRLFALERLAGYQMTKDLQREDPQVFRIVSACVACHREAPGAVRGPRSVASLFLGIPGMTTEKRDEMIEQSELNEEDRARFLKYAEELVKMYGR